MEAPSLFHRLFANQRITKDGKKLIFGELLRYTGIRRYIFAVFEELHERPVETNEALLFFAVKISKHYDEELLFVKTRFGKKSDVAKFGPWFAPYIQYCRILEVVCDALWRTVLEPVREEQMLRLFIEELFRHELVNQKLVEKNMMCNFDFDYVDYDFNILDHKTIPPDDPLYENMVEICLPTVNPEDFEPRFELELEPVVQGKVQINLEPMDIDEPVAGENTIEIIVISSGSETEHCNGPTSDYESDSKPKVKTETPVKKIKTLKRNRSLKRSIYNSSSGSDVEPIAETSAQNSNKGKVRPEKKKFAICETNAQNGNEEEIFGDMKTDFASCDTDSNEEEIVGLENANSFFCDTDAKNNNEEEIVGPEKNNFAICEIDAQNNNEEEIVGPEKNEFAICETDAKNSDEEEIVGPENANSYFCETDAKNNNEEEIVGPEKNEFAICETDAKNSDEEEIVGPEKNEFAMVETDAQNSNEEEIVGPEKNEFTICETDAKKNNEEEIVGPEKNEFAIVKTDAQNSNEVKIVSP
ncbi:unnamed protein product [Brassicogethes aeneus]|uniref:Uncharacterized protein n=1 Tax=Brassicogethes aeneus TaxID=1431903 RepID=A0A9P0BHI6_BRAAE|nr:unnamed protein product [Brassicogethes aeneus]